MSNRASYQRLNPNMSLTPVAKNKKPMLLFKDREGVTFTKYLTPSKLKPIVAYHPMMTTTSVLISMLDGSSFQCGDTTVSIVYK